VSDELGSVRRGVDGTSGPLGQLRRGFDDVQASARGFAEGQGGLAAAIVRVAPAAALAAAAVAGFALVMKQGIREAAEAEQASLKLEAVLKATGHAAGLTASQIEDLADSLERSTLNTAEQIKDTASVLLTFKSVAGEAFTRAVKVAADLAAVMGGDVRSSALQLGKALEDPVEGLTALRRSGVSFTAAQKEVIQSLVDTGRKAEAIDKVLEAVEQQVSGAAAGQAGGLTGATHRLAAGWGNVTEELAKASGAFDMVKRKMESVAGAANAIADVLKIAQSPEYRLGQVESQITQMRRNPPRGIGGANAGRQLESLLAQRESLRGDIEIAAQASEAAALGAVSAAAERQKEAVDATAKSVATLTKEYAEQARIAGLPAQQAERELAARKAIEELRKAAKEAGGVKPTEAQEQEAGAAARRVVAAKQFREEQEKSVALLVKQVNLSIDSQWEMLGGQRESILANQALQAEESKRTAAFEDYLVELEREPALIRMSVEQRAEEEAVLRSIQLLGRELTANEEARVRVAARKVEEEKKQVKAAEAAAAEWVKIWDNAAENIQDSLASGFRKALDGGIRNFRDFKDLALDFIKDLAAQMAAALVIRPIVQGAFGAIGLGSTAAAAAGGGGGAGSLLSSAGNAASIWNLLPSGMTGGPMDLIGGIGSALGFGGGGATAAGMAGLDAVAAGEFANMAIMGGGASGMGGGAMAGLGAAMPYVGAALAAGTLAYSLFGKKKRSVGPGGSGAVLIGPGGAFGQATSADNGYTGGQTTGIAQEAAAAINRIAAAAGATVNERAIAGWQEQGGRLMFGFNGEGYGLDPGEDPIGSYIRAALGRGALDGGDQRVIQEFMSGKSIEQVSATFAALREEAEALAKSLRQAATDLRLDSNLSILTAQQQYDLSRSQLDSTVAGAAANDREALGRLANDVTAFLRQSMSFFGRTGAYETDFNTGQSILDRFARQAEQEAANLPRFALGGRPPVGRMALVGERGPELFVADRPGTIVPNHELPDFGQPSVGEERIADLLLRMVRQQEVANHGTASALAMARAGRRRTAA